MKFSSFTVVALAAILGDGGYALPAPRASSSDHSVSHLMGGALRTVLQSKGATDFRAIPGGRQVNWLGETKSDKITDEFGNAMIYSTVDLVRDRNATSGETFFADAYKNFVVAVNEALHLDGSDVEDEDELSEMAKDVTEICDLANDLASDLRDKFRDRAKSRRPDGPGPTPAQLDRAIQSDAQWTTANAECVEITSKMNAKKSDLFGPNFALFSLTYKNVQPLIDAKSRAVEGITMPTDKAAAGGSLLSDSKIGNVVPLYEIPALNATVMGWQERADDAEPEFKWNSAQTSSKNSSDSTESHSSFKLDFLGLKKSSNKKNTKKNEQATKKAHSLEVTFGAIDLLDVETGLWFDRYRMAHAAQNTQDDKEQPARELFQKYFGTKDDPMPAAQYNQKALVAYQVAWSMKFSNKKDTRKFLESSVESSSDFLWVHTSKGQAKMSDVAETSSDGLTVEYKPKNKNAVILGYTVHNYFGRDRDDE